MDQVQRKKETALTGMPKRIELEMRGRPHCEIKELNLDNCRVTEIDGLSSDFSALESLSLINSGLSTLNSFPKLGNLTKLELSDNRISGGLQALTGCPKLTHISLSGNKIKDIEALKPLKDLPNLKNLDLFNCEITNEDDYRDKVFGILPQIKYLDGFDQNDEECEEDDEEDEDDDDENEDEEDDDEEGGVEVGLEYLTKENLNEEDEEEDFDPDADDDDDEVGVDEDDDDEDEEEDEEDDEDEAEPRGQKRKHEDEEQEEA